MSTQNKMSTARRRTIVDDVAALPGLIASSLAAVSWPTQNKRNLMYIISFSQSLYRYFQQHVETSFY